jgi:hypothetical protein
MPRFAAAVALVTFAASAVMAEESRFPQNPNIDVVYAVPTDKRLLDTYDRMRELDVMRTLQEFLSPLKLGRTIAVRLDQCGSVMSVPHERNGPVIVCYEHLNLIRASAPRDGYISFDEKRKLTSDQAIAGGVARLLLYETAHGVFDSLNIPIWGRRDEAADNVAALIMLDFGEEVAWTSILGSAWYLAQRGLLGAGYFSDAARPQEAQRFYNYLCIAYGKQPKTYEFLVNNFNLPGDRAKLCREEYHKLSRAFRTLFKDRIDPVLLRQVRARQDWLAN